MARSDYTHKMVDGVRVDLTEAEIDAKVAAEEAHAAQKSAREFAKSVQSGDVEAQPQEDPQVSNNEDNAII